KRCGGHCASLANVSDHSAAARTRVPRSRVMGGRLWVVGLPPALLARRQAGEVVLHQIFEADRDVVVLEALDRLILVAGLDLAVVDLGVVLESLLGIGVLDRVVGREGLAVLDALLPRRGVDRIVDGGGAR